MTLTAGCVVQANDTYTKVIDLYEYPPLFIYHNLMLEFAMQRWRRGGLWEKENEETQGEKPDRANVLGGMQSQRARCTLGKWSPGAHQNSSTILSF